MTGFKLFWIVMAIVSVPFSWYLGFTQGGSENLLENGGFEERGENGLPRGWRIIPAYAGKGEAFRDDQYANSGRYSLRITPNKRNTSEGFGAFMMLDPGKVQGKEITISGFVRVGGNGGNGTAILLKTEKENWIPLPKDTGGKFVPFSQTFSISKTAPETGLLLLVGGTKGSVWFDDLSLRVAQGSISSNLKTPGGTLKASDGDYVNKINTPGWQDSVFISPDGQELYFAYLPYTQKDFMDIYFKKIKEKDVKVRGPIRPGSRGTMLFETYKSVKNKDGSWGKPVSININSTYSLYSAKLSFDGTELYYALRDSPGNYGGDDIYVSKKLPDGNWSPPENLGPNINTRFREDTPCLTADGKTLYFARNKKEMLGWEIMYSLRVNGKWGLAEKLSLPINETSPEKTANYQPFITADEKEFYFTRVTHIYKSEKQPNGTWGKPVKVFPQLLVSGHASVTADGRYIYFLTAEDKESLKREHWTIWYAERQKDGRWGDPKPVD